LNSQDREISNIHVGLDDIQISSVDIRNGSFHADFSYWLKYDAPKLDTKKYLIFRNLTKGDEKELPQEKEGQTGIYRLFKMSGDFEMNADLKRYPLDRQEVTIELEAIYPREKLHISFDHENYKNTSTGFRVHPADEWDKIESYVTVDDVIAESFGGPASSRDKKLQKFETLNIRTIIRRPRKGAWVAIILPLCMIGLAAVGLLYVRDTAFASIGHVCVVMFLTIATYRISFAALIPNSGGLTVADKLFFGTFLTVFLVFLRAIILNSGMITERLRGWINDRTSVIGHATLIIYCVMVVLALTGSDALIYKDIKQWFHAVVLLLLHKG
jgi:hypothetical protein